MALLVANLAVRALKSMSTTRNAFRPRIMVPARSFMISVEARDLAVLLVVRKDLNALL